MHELTTLIDLCPGIRLPQYEPGIFPNNDLTEYYLHKLCEQYRWYDHVDSAPGLAYCYARFVMKSRWPEAEHIIATAPQHAYLYARHVMKSRWYEVEAIIATADIYRKWYNRNFGTNI